MASGRPAGTVEGLRRGRSKTPMLTITHTQDQSETGHSRFLQLQDETMHSGLLSEPLNLSPLNKLAGGDHRAWKQLTLTL